MALSRHGLAGLNADLDRDTLWPSQSDAPDTNTGATTSPDESEDGPSNPDADETDESADPDFDPVSPDVLAETYQTVAAADPDQARQFQDAITTLATLEGHPSAERLAIDALHFLGSAGTITPPPPERSDS